MVPEELKPIHNINQIALALLLKSSIIWLRFSEPAEAPDATLMLKDHTKPLGANRLLDMVPSRDRYLRAKLLYLSNNGIPGELKGQATWFETAFKGIRHLAISSDYLQCLVYRSEIRCPYAIWAPAYKKSSHSAKFNTLRVMRCRSSCIY